MKRIQRKREKGWRMPESSVSVCRPHKFGNPLKLQGDLIYIDAGWRRKILDKWVLLCHGDIEDLIRIYKSILFNDIRSLETKDLQSFMGFVDLHHHAERLKKLDFSVLKGKDLACFCSLNDPCHADVIIEFLNSR